LRLRAKNEDAPNAEIFTGFHINFNAGCARQLTRLSPEIGALLFT